VAKTKLVLVNDRGRRIGETHPRAKLTDHEVDLIRELAEEGMTHREIAAKFDVTKDAIKSIGSYRRRAYTPSRMKRVPA
jgi:DNA-directed RNA polymerase specialized sigma24 family protein